MLLVYWKPKRACTYSKWRINTKLLFVSEQCWKFDCILWENIINTPTLNRGDKRCWPTTLCCWIINTLSISHKNAQTESRSMAEQTVLLFHTAYWDVAVLTVISIEVSPRLFHTSVYSLKSNVKTCHGTGEKCCFGRRGSLPSLVWMWFWPTSSRKSNLLHKCSQNRVFSQTFRAISVVGLIFVFSEATQAEL